MFRSVKPQWRSIGNDRIPPGTRIFRVPLRFNRDPVGEAGGENLYAFVGNDPVNGRDFMGLMDLYYLNYHDVIGRDCDILVGGRCMTWEQYENWISAEGLGGMFGEDGFSVTDFGTLSYFTSGANRPVRIEKGTIDPEEARGEDLPPCSQVRRDYIRSKLPDTGGIGAFKDGAVSVFRGFGRSLVDVWELQPASAIWNRDAFSRQIRNRFRFGMAYMKENLRVMGEFASGDFSHLRDVRNTLYVGRLAAEQNWEFVAGRIGIGFGTGSVLSYTAHPVAGPIFGVAVYQGDLSFAIGEGFERLDAIKPLDTLVTSALQLGIDLGLPNEFFTNDKVLQAITNIPCREGE